jgi:hypothetical protein
VSIAHDWGVTAAIVRSTFPAIATSPPAIVFRWLCQLRTAPYSYDWIDNWDRQSPRTLMPGLEDLAVGQRVMTIFDLVEFEPGRHLTVVLRDGRGIFGQIAGTYLVAPRRTERHGSS